MTSYNDTAGLLMGIADQRDRQAQQQQQDWIALMNQAAQFTQGLRRDQLANQQMNQLQPPRADAINPGAPGVMDANSLYGGPTAPHSGGIDELALMMKMRDQKMQEDLARLKMEGMQQDLELAPKLADWKMSKVLGAPTAAQSAVEDRFQRSLAARDKMFNRGLAKSEMGNIQTQLAKQEAALAQAAGSLGLSKEKLASLYKLDADPQKRKQRLLSAYGLDEESSGPILAGYDEYLSLQKRYDDAKQRALGNEFAGVEDDLAMLDDPLPTDPSKPDEPALTTGDPKAEAEGVKEMLRRGAITRDEAISRLKQLGFQ